MTQRTNRLSALDLTEQDERDLVTVCGVYIWEQSEREIDRDAAGLSPNPDASRRMNLCNRIAEALR